MAELYRPSSGTEGAAFFESWCSKCARDASLSTGKNFDDCAESEICQIVGDSFIGPVKEWIYDKEGCPTCTAFVPVGQPLPTERCAHTKDMFGEESHD